MHGNVVPTPIQTTGAERTIRLDPILSNPFNDRSQRCFQLREAVAQQKAQIDALSAIIKLTLVNGQAWCLGKRFRESILIKEILKVIFRASSQRFQTRFVASLSVNLSQGLHDEAGVEVINKVTH